MSKKVLAIDPGPESSGYMVWDGRKIVDYSILPNGILLDTLLSADFKKVVSSGVLAIEWITGYGMTVGAETFQTCRWVGRFEQAWEGQVELIPRRDVKLALCETVKAKDKDVRQALIEKLGKPGTKKNPGVTYGITSHLWAALAVAVVCEERMRKRMDAERYVPPERLPERMESNG